MSLFTKRCSRLLRSTVQQSMAGMASSVPPKSPGERNSETLTNILMSANTDPPYGRQFNRANANDETSPPTGPSGQNPPPAKGINPLTASRQGSSSKNVSQIVSEARLYHLHAQCSKNNAIFTFTNREGNPIAWTSGGNCGFKTANRKSYEAGYQCAVRIFQAIREEKQKSVAPMDLHLHFKGMGPARDALNRALQSMEGDVVRDLIRSISDRTPIKIGGTRAPKRRKL